MNILYTSKTPLAGVCEKMARVVNTYCRPLHQARVLNKGAGKHRWYERNPEKGLVPSFSIMDKDQVAACMKWADVIHCMANVGLRVNWFSHLNSQKLLKSKIWVFQWHGAQIWDFRGVWQPEDYSRIRFLHIGQGWIQTQKDFFQFFIDNHGMRRVPNIITGDDPLHQPISWDRRKSKIGFAPSRRLDDKINQKGVQMTLDALRGVQYDLMCGLPFERCLVRKSKCRLGLDEVVSPMYHLSGLEFLSQGTPCICSLSPYTEDVLRQVTGCDRIPFINATPETLRKVVNAYWMKHHQELQDMGKDARSWFDEFYHPKQLIERYIDVYEE